MKTSHLNRKAPEEDCATILRLGEKHQELVPVKEFKTGERLKLTVHV